jgi:hypothetical protein
MRNQWLESIAFIGLTTFTHFKNAFSSMHLGKKYLPQVSGLRCQDSGVNVVIAKILCICQKNNLKFDVLIQSCLINAQNTTSITYTS